MRVDESSHTSPSVVRLSLKLRLFAVEEAVGRIRLHDDLALYTGFRQRVAEGLDDRERDALVRAAEDAQDRAVELTHGLGGSRRVVAGRSARPAVEANDARQPQSQSGGQEGVAAAHAEAGHEYRGPGRRGAGHPQAPIAQECRGRYDVGRQAGPSRLGYVRARVERFVAIADPRGPAEVVDGDCLDAGLGEAHGQLLVVAVQAANVGQDDDRLAGRRRRPGMEGLESIAVGGGEDQRLAFDGGPGRFRYRGLAVQIEAHGSTPVGGVEPILPAGCPDDNADGYRLRLAVSRRAALAGRMPAMPKPLVVQKYGGSSVANADRIRRVAARVARERANGYDLVVVVSAMGDATDELLALAGAITDEPDARELDMLLATGEHQSATLVSMALHALGVSAIALSGAQAGITTDGNYGKARIAGIDTKRILSEIEAGRVVIVAGFQGQSVRDPHLSEITTLGRGGSDTTGVALAAALEADRCQIFTDVRGIYTADPRLVPEARQLPVISYEEMMELAHQGAQVMQVRAVELGWVNNVVIEVLSSFEDVPGTLIKEDPFVEQRNKVRGLAHDRNVAKVTLVEVPDRPGVAHSVFAPLAEAGINVDTIVQNVGHHGTTDLSFTITRGDLAKTKRILEPIVRELGFREMTTDSAMAKVSIVGAGIQNAPGYASRMFAALAEAGVNIEIISTSEIRITCMIAEDQVETAVRALHKAFALEEPEPLVQDEAGAAGTGGATKTGA